MENVAGISLVSAFLGDLFFPGCIDVVTCFLEIEYPCGKSEAATQLKGIKGSNSRFMGAKVL